MNCRSTALPIHNPRPALLPDPRAHRVNGTPPSTVSLRYDVIPTRPLLSLAGAMATATASACSDTAEVPVTDRRVVCLAVLSHILRGLAPPGTQDPHATLSQIADGQGDATSAESFRAMALCRAAVESAAGPAYEWMENRYGATSSPDSPPTLPESLRIAQVPPVQCERRRVRVGDYIYSSSHFDTLLALWRIRNPAHGVLSRLTNPGSLGGIPAVLDPEAIVASIVGTSLDDAVDQTVAALHHLLDMQS